MTKISSEAVIKFLMQNLVVLMSVFFLVNIVLYFVVKFVELKFGENKSGLHDLICLESF